MRIQLIRIELIWVELSCIDRCILCSKESWCFVRSSACPEYQERRWDDNIMKRKKKKGSKILVMKEHMLWILHLIDTSNIHIIFHRLILKDASQLSLWTIHPSITSPVYTHIPYPSLFLSLFSFFSNSLSLVPVLVPVPFFARSPPPSRRPQDPPHQSVILSTIVYISDDRGDVGPSYKNQTNPDPEWI